ncbi:MAG: tetratricopeptide repeat protein, partial [Pseudomonadota bacterium]
PQAERRVAMAHALILEDNAQGAADLYEGMDPEDFGEQDYRMTLWILHELDEADQFEAGMDAALEAYPDSADLNTMAAEALIELDEPEEAAAYVERALASDPNHFEALLAKGELAIEAEDLEGALATYRATAEAYPDHPLPLANIAGLQLDLERVEAAGETLKSAMAAHPDEPFLQWQLARYALATDDLDTARAALETARRTFRSVDEFTLLSAQAEERFGNTSLALSEYKRYLRAVGEDDAIEAKVAALEAGVS